MEEIFNIATSDVTMGILSIVVIVWLVSKFFDKQQEQIMLHNEQINKFIEVTATLSQHIAELTSLLREGNEKTDHVSDKVDELSRKIDVYGGNQLHKDSKKDKENGTDEE